MDNSLGEAFPRRGSRVLLPPQQWFRRFSSGSRIIWTSCEAFGTKDNDKHGLWNCLKTLRKLDGGKIKPIKELGELVINLLVEYYSEMILSE